jgi:hypothetical protein
MDFVSMDSDGFTLIIDDDFPLNYQIGYFALDGIEAVETGTLTEPASTGNQATSGLGFSPDFLLFLSVSDATAPPTQDTNMKFTLGAATGGKQYVTLQVDDDATGFGDSYRYTYDGECVALGTDGNGSAIDGRASWVSMDSDGFTLNWLERTGARLVFWLAVKGGNWALGDILSQTGGSNFSETGLGFPPEGVVFISHCAAKSTQDTRQADHEMSLGAANSATSRFSFVTNKVNVLGGATHKHLHRTTGCWGSFDGASTGTTIEAEMDFVSLDADGFTVVMDDPDVTNNFIWYIGFQQGVVVPRTRLVKYLHNTYISRDAGRPIVHDVLGREVPVEQIQADQWLYADGPLFLTAARPQSLILDPRAYYIESLTSRGDKVDIVTAREGLLENLFRRLSRSG